MKKSSGHFKVTPWEVKGDVDYSKLIKKFGLRELSHLPRVFQKEVLFRRGHVFAHRDFEKIVDAIEKKKKFIMLTGLMPTGKFHLGHALIAKQIVFYQNLGAKVYVTVADLEAYSLRGQGLEESNKIAADYISNYIALGLNLKKCDVYFQSNRSEDGVKASAYYRLQNLLAKHVTFNEFKAVYGDITPGKMLSSLIQASDILHAQLPEFEGKMPVVVPVGADQDPHLRLTRDLAKRLKKPGFEQVSSTYNTFLPGLKGGKMSASEENSHIAMTDSAEEVERKIRRYAFSGGQKSLEEHRKHGGNPDVDVSFQYLNYFFEESDSKLAKMEKDYRSGKLLTGELKEYTIKKINGFLKGHQAKMKKAKKEVEKFVG